MSNKTQLQENNQELQSILNEIQGLPGGVTINLGTQEGGLIGELSKDTTSGYYKMASTEDPFGEIEDQSPLLAQLVDLVSKKYMIEGNYVWKKYEYDSGSSAAGDFIEYVISDASDTYPDGGAQDGYWYEKNKDILTAEKLGYTKIAVDTFTLTTNASGTKTVNHSLGDLPKFLFLLSDDTTDGYIRVYFCSYYGNEAMNIKYYNDNGNVVIYDASSISNPTWNTTQLQIFATSSTKLRAGQEYTLITMA